MGVHGMLLFGSDPLYLSHLPMFGSPHNFQVILEVTFDEAGAEILRSDRDETGNGLYTFEPVEFDITELDPRHGPTGRTTIDGTVYRGHFERGGEPLTRVTAVVRQVAYFDELDVRAEHDTDRELEYLCVGRPPELHLAHHVTASPDFDQVLSVEMVAGTVRDPAGRPVGEEATNRFDRAVPVVFAGRTDIPTFRLRPDETVEGFFRSTVGPTGSHGFRVDIVIRREWYLELRELGSVEAVP